LALPLGLASPLVPQRRKHICRDVSQRLKVPCISLERFESEALLR
jgi:hypothetical protein